MAVLNYVTKEGKAPRRESKIWFCAHPEDHAEFFEQICSELFEYADCSVWYESSGCERDDEFLSELEGMRLFVMPVTSKLLKTDNYALGREFAFAVEKHIPVLPLMLEGGLEPLFNQKCGDIQFLDRYGRDMTAIKYEVKLEKFLGSVLMNDEMLEKIRSAFDAYIFLSYRKKDRSYAQELMSLIHKNEVFRDIAIWYDEFLVPGENFNDSIADALKMSDLFVLTLTPNVVNEQNYILNCEYPMARAEGKPILVGEMLPTDRALLKGRLADIPECTDAHNATALSDALLSALKTLAVRENDSSPEHLFFIGLAYLGGIDVEVDRERGVSLLKKAAEKGLPDAQLKLTEMYSYGEGVKKDRREANGWAKLLVKTRKRILRSDKSIENADKYLYSIRYLIATQSALERSRSVRKMTREARKLARELSCLELMKYAYAYLMVQNPVKQMRELPLLEKLCASVADDTVFDTLANTYNMIGERYSDKGRFDRALEYHLKAVRTAYRARDVIGPRSLAYDERDMLLFDLIMLAENETENYEKILNTMKSLYDEYGDEVSRKYYALAHADLARVLEYGSARDYVSAAEHAREALGILNEIAKTSPAENLEYVFDTLVWLEDICRKLESEDEARGYFNEARKTLELMERYTRSAIDRAKLTQNYIRLIELTSGEEAEEMCKDASRVLLAAEIDVELTDDFYLRQISEMHVDLGYTLKIEEHLLKSIEIRRQMASRGDVRSALDVIETCYYVLADITEDPEKKIRYTELMIRHKKQNRFLIRRFYRPYDKRNI